MNKKTDCPCLADHSDAFSDRPHRLPTNLEDGRR